MWLEEASTEATLVVGMSLRGRARDNIVDAVIDAFCRRCARWSAALSILVQR